MFGLGEPKPVAEHEAKGEIERVYHEIRQVFRVTGVNLNFRTWADYGKFLPVMWDAVRPNTESRAFEDAADRIRVDVAGAAEALGRLDAASTASRTLATSSCSTSRTKWPIGSLPSYQVHDSDEGPRATRRWKKRRSTRCVGR